MKYKGIVLPGGAGLVGQNLVARLRARGYTDIVVLDKHRANLAVLKQVQPDIVAEYADLAEMQSRYDVARLRDGWNHDARQPFFFIRNPALGLWRGPE